MVSHTTISTKDICANNIQAGTISNRKKIRNIMYTDGMITFGAYAYEYLTIADSGTIFNITQSTDKHIIIQLPTASTDAEALQLVGWYATFVIGAVGDKSVTIGVISSDKDRLDTISGSVATSGQDTLTSVILGGTFVILGLLSDCVVGESVDIFCIASTASAATYLARGFANT